MMKHSNMVFGPSYIVPSVRSRIDPAILIA